MSKPVDRVSRVAFKQAVRAPALNRMPISHYDIKHPPLGVTCDVGAAGSVVLSGPLGRTLVPSHMVESVEMWTPDLDEADKAAREKAERERVEAARLQAEKEAAEVA